MMAELVDTRNETRISELTARVLNGEEISRGEAMGMFDLEGAADIFDLMAGANRIREHFKGNKIHLCSIVNAKAGACSENCSFCAQSSFYQTGSPKYGFVDPEPVREAAEEAQQQQRHGAGPGGGVARTQRRADAGRGVRAHSRIGGRSGKTRADASLGIIKSQHVADRLKEAGLECYGHNLESSKRFFPSALHDAYLRRAAGNDSVSQESGHQDLFRGNYRHGRNARRPLRPGVRA